MSFLVKSNMVVFRYSVFKLYSTETTNPKRGVLEKSEYRKVKCGEKGDTHHGEDTKKLLNRRMWFRDGRVRCKDSIRHATMCTAGMLGK